MTESDQQLLNDIINRFYDDLDHGRVPDRQQLLEANPTIAEKLRHFFEQHDHSVYLAQKAKRFDDLPSAQQDDPETQGISEVVRQAMKRLDFKVNTPTIPMIDEPNDLIVGKYKLLEKINDGGMGSVWKAEQREPVKRLVAIKLIKPGYANKETLARFDAERQALALMDHPNIAKVFDGGLTQDGSPFFVMELVSGGQPITQFCDRYKLSTFDRLKLFVSVCEAIHHAHQKGIIHRDIKPNNILVSMVDDRPLVKVIDFGVAKTIGASLTEMSLSTKLNALIGTPLYMSPEQAEMKNADIDTRSDVYSLGVLLYQLMTGVTPFVDLDSNQVGMLEILRRIREVEPLRPSVKLTQTITANQTTVKQNSDLKKLHQLLSGELDWITLKTLEKDRSRRYESAHSLAADVRRYLAGDSVEAVPPSFSYRLQKTVNQNRGLFIAVSLVFLALLAGVVGTSIGFWKADKAKNAEIARAEAEAKAKTEAEAARDQARQRFQLALAAYNQMVFGIQNKLENRPGTLDLRKDLLENARTGLQQLRNDALHQGNPDSTLVWTYLRVGDVETYLGNNDLALTEYRTANEIASKLAKESPEDVRTQRDLCVSFERLGSLNQKMGQLTTAVENYTHALALSKQFVELDPKNQLAQRDLSVILVNLGDVSLEQRQPKKAYDYFQQALVIRKPLINSGENGIDAERDVSVCHDRIGNVLLQINRLSLAKKSFLQSQEIIRRLAEKVPKNVEVQRDLSVNYERLGDVDSKLGQLQGAYQLYEKSFQISERLVNEDSKNIESQRDAVLILFKLVQASRQQGELATELTWCRTAIKLISDFSLSDRFQSEKQAFEKRMEETTTIQKPSIDFNAILMQQNLPVGQLLNAKVRFLVKQNQSKEAKQLANQYANWAEHLPLQRSHSMMNAARALAVSSGNGKSLDADVVKRSLELLNRLRDLEGLATDRSLLNQLFSEDFNSIREDASFREFLKTVDLRPDQESDL